MNTSYLCDGEVGRAVADGCERLIVFASGEPAQKLNAATLLDEIRRGVDAFTADLDTLFKTIEAAGFDGSSFRRNGKSIAGDFRQASDALQAALLAAQRTTFAVLDLPAWEAAASDALRAATRAQQLLKEMTARARARGQGGGPEPLGGGT